MEFIKDLEKFLSSSGFRKYRVASGMTGIWTMDSEDKTNVIAVIPERLAGQKKTDPEERDRQLNAVNDEIMLKQQKKTDLLKLFLYKSMPVKEEVSLNSQDPSSWMIIEDENNLLIYETQRSDFCGIRKGLEKLLAETPERNKTRLKESLKNVFTPVTTFIFILNVVIFILLSLFGSTLDTEYMLKNGALSWYMAVEKEEFYRLITSMFIHFGFAHLLSNMLILLLIGSRLEKAVGTRIFMVTYMFSGIVASLASLYFTLHDNPYAISGGASGAIFGLMGGMAGLLLWSLLWRKKEKIQEIGLPGLLFMIGSALYYGFVDKSIDNAAHLAGLAGGFFIMFVSLIVYTPVQNQKKRR